MTKDILGETSGWNWNGQLPKLTLEEATNDQGAKSQSNPNDQAPNPKEEFRRRNVFWDLVIGAWDLIGVWLLGHWDFQAGPALLPLPNPI
jgi:hypothetical protein